MDRDTILNAKTIRNELVDVPEWGGRVMIRGMNAPERVEFFSRVESIKGLPSRVGILLLIASLCNEAGEKLMSDADAEALETHDGALINRLCAIANRVNGIGADDAQKK